MGKPDRQVSRWHLKLCAAEGILALRWDLSSGKAASLPLTQLTPGHAPTTIIYMKQKHTQCFHTEVEPGKQSSLIRVESPEPGASKCSSGVTRASVASLGPGSETSLFSRNETRELGLWEQGYNLSTISFFQEIWSPTKACRRATPRWKIRDEKRWTYKGKPGHHVTEVLFFNSRTHVF